jgi:hypothetical protein
MALFGAINNVWGGEVGDLIVDHLGVLIALLVTLAAAGILWLHFGR